MRPNGSPLGENSNSNTNDEFDVIENTSFEEKKESIENTNKDRFNYVLSKVPLLFFLLLFTDVEKTEDLNKHIKQSLILFLIYISLAVLLAGFLSTIITLFYFGLSSYLAYNAYYFRYIELTGEKQIMDFIDKNILKK